MDDPVIGDRTPVVAGRTRSGRSSLAAILAMTVIAFAVVILAEDLIFLFNGAPGAFLFSLTFVLLVANLGLVGGLLAVRRPDNVIGWLLLVAGLPEGVGIAGSMYARLDDLLGPGRMPLVVPAAWLGTWTIPPIIGILVIFLPIVFPTGRLPGPRWRIFIVVALIAMTIGAVASATAPGPLDGIDRLSNPLVLPSPVGDWVQGLGGASLLVALAGMVLGVGSMVGRLRRSRGMEREQLKWLMFVGAIAAICLGSSIILVSGPMSDAMWILGLLAMAFVPIAIGVAVLRYRLYEIDRIVSRTIGWGVTTALVAGLFAGLIVALQDLLTPITSGSGLAVAGSTLAAAAIFQPARRRIQATVDHRFNRSRYDAERTIGGLATSLRGGAGLDELEDRVVGTAIRTFRPAAASLWIRPR